MVTPMQASPAAQDVARSAARLGVVPAELQGSSAGMVREQLTAALGSDLSPAEWSQVLRLLASHLERAAKSAGRGVAGSCSDCGQPVRWADTVAGRHMALNPIPHERGNVTLEPRGSVLLARVHGLDEIPISDRPAYRPHVATCRRRRQPTAPPAKEAPRCRVCGQPMDRDLYAAGERDHPCCAPDPAVTR